MTRELIKFTLIKPGEYEVHYENGCFLGHALIKEDGFYDFWPDLKGGFWSAYVLREIADKLDELNAPYEAQINEYFEQERLREIREFKRRIEEL